MLKVHHHLARAIAASICAAGLAACGGGGGGGSGGSGETTTLGITGNNQEVVARTALSSAYFLDITSGGLVGAEVSANPQLLKLIVDAVREGMKHAGNQQTLLTGAAVTSSVTCTSGGNYDITVDDKTGNGTVDTGDSFAFDYKSCKSSSGLVTFGRIAVAVESMTGDYFGTSYSTTLSITTSGYGTLLSNGQSLQGEGNFKLSFSLTPAGVGDMTLVVDRFTVTANSASVHNSVTLTDGRLTQHAETVAGHYQMSNSFSGKVASTELGNQQVVVSTPQPLLNVDYEAFYSSGQVLVRGAGSALRITAVDRYQVRLELDANADGTYESQQLKYWIDLL